MILASLYYLSLVLSLLTLLKLSQDSPQTLSYSLHSSHSLKTLSFSNFLRCKTPLLPKKEVWGRGGGERGDHRDNNLNVS
jgi:hypothetical protein